MNGIIQSLPEDLRNKISAGEVVERPASVVKELLENSLDAKATEINIVVEKGGQSLIQVRDNGQGMSADDLPRAFERFSTSKISTLNDLFSIETLGFRGEALASIASISQITLRSGIQEDESWEIRYREGTPSEIQPATAISGTEITVVDLFYNTPARRKFLKSPRVELRHVVQTVRRYGLAYPEVRFFLIADGKEILNLAPESLDDRIASVFDPTYRDNIIPIHFIKGDYAFSGFVGNLNLIRTRPGEQFIFLNRRSIRDRLLNSAVYAAYQSAAKRGEYPFFVLNLVIPSDQVDVNVHPMKTEVRFKDEWRVYQVLKSGVSEVLENVLEILPFLRKPFPELDLSRAGSDASRQSAMSFSPQGNPQTDRTAIGLQRAKSYASDLAVRPEAETGVASDNIWQIHDRYILSQINSGLVIIDQHVAHERILFEEALAAFEEAPLASQTLLFPETLEFSPDEFSVLLDLLPFLEKIGFRMREFGKHTVMVEAIPSEMGWGNEKRVIKDILDHYLNHHKEYSSFQEGLAASFACHAAIKAGDTLTREEMQELVNRLFGTNHPYYCPHGRPIIVQLTLDELDQRFERK